MIRIRRTTAAGLTMIGTPDSYPFPTRPAPLRFGIGLAAVATVFAIDWIWNAGVDDGSHFLLLGTAVMATAWVAGTGPALAATVASALIGAWDAPASAGAVRATQTHL